MMTVWIDMMVMIWMMMTKKITRVPIKMIYAIMRIGRRRRMIIRMMHKWMRVMTDEDENGDG